MQNLKMSQSFYFGTFLVCVLDILEDEEKPKNLEISKIENLKQYKLNAKEKYN